MKITAVSVRVRNAADTAAFYANVLGLPVAHHGDLTVVMVGATRLELVEDTAAAGDHHFAIGIPANKFTEAKSWIRARAGLIGTPDADEFECAPSWDARSLYFDGPDRSVLEFIIRRQLPNATAGPFSSADLLGISEVGVAVPGVPATARRLEAEADIAPYGDAPGDDFAPVGDVDGLLILVGPGRPWFPTGLRHAQESPVAITAAGGRPGDYPLGSMASLRILA